MVIDLTKFFGKCEEFAQNDSMVKSIFDHLRNIGLIALVFAALSWKIKNISAGWLGTLEWAIVIPLHFFGFFLLWLNHENMAGKIRKNHWPASIRLIFAVLYGIIFFELISYLMFSKY